MSSKKFATEEEYQTAVNRMEYKSQVYLNVDDLTARINQCPVSSQDLKDALLFLRMVDEKVKSHNAQCRQTAGKMKNRQYMRNNIQNYQG